MKRTSECTNARHAAGVGGGDHGHPQPAARRVRPYIEVLDLLRAEILINCKYTAQEFVHPAV